MGSLFCWVVWDLGWLWTFQMDRSDGPFRRKIRLTSTLCVGRRSCSPYSCECWRQCTSVVTSRTSPLWPWHCSGTQIQILVLCLQWSQSWSLVSLHRFRAKHFGVGSETQVHLPIYVAHPASIPALLCCSHRVAVPITLFEHHFRSVTLAFLRNAHPYT